MYEYRYGTKVSKAYMRQVCARHNKVVVQVVGSDVPAHGQTMPVGSRLLGPGSVKNCIKCENTLAQVRVRQPKR